MKIFNLLFYFVLLLGMALILKRNIFTQESRPRIVRKFIKNSSIQHCWEIPESETLRVSLYSRCYPQHFVDRKTKMLEGRHEEQELDLSQ